LWFSKRFADSLPLLGGTCNEKLSAETWDGMVKAMTRHVMEKHPYVAKAMEAMHKEGSKGWGREMKPKRGGGAAGLNGLRGDPPGVIRANYWA
jgi:hypothetical protein